MTESNDAEVVLQARDIWRSYTLGQEEIPVLQGLNLTLRAGETVSVLGASGSGKTTMIQILGLLDKPSAGELVLGGQDMFCASAATRSRVRNQSLGFIFQFYHLVPELSALENVMLPARIQGGMFRWFGMKAASRQRARDLLAQMGLTDRAKHRPSQLSGGERQRVAIARALMNEPQVIFCDEPTGNLDPRTKGGIEDILFETIGGDRALLLVTHDERFAKRCDRVLRLKEGTLVPDDDATPPGGEA